MGATYLKTLGRLRIAAVSETPDPQAVQLSLVPQGAPAETWHSFDKLRMDVPRHLLGDGVEVGGVLEVCVREVER